MGVNQSPVEAQRVATSLVRYRKDFRAFAQEQLRLTAAAPIKFWPCQIPIIDSVEQQFAERGFVRSVCLKARQVGLSTLAQCFVSWRTMLWPNVNAIVIADEARRAQTLFEIARGFYDYMDPDIRPVGRYVTKRELVFANPSHVTRAADPGLRSRIVIDSAHKKNIAIGASWTIALLSEAARYREPSFVFDGIIPAVHRIPGTMIMIESSAEMAGTWYRDFFEDAQKGRNGFVAQFVPWFLQPEYFICPVCKKVAPNICTDLEHVKRGMKMMDFSADEHHLMAEYKLGPGHIQWMREKFSEFGNNWDLFRQNFPLTPEDAWVTPGAQVFPSKQLKDLRELIRPPLRRCEVHPGPRINDAPGGRLQIWKEPETSKAYDIGVDVASGAADSEEQDTLDYSVICVLERGSNDQVAEFCSKTVDAYELATTLYWLGLYYNTAQIAVETNAIGGATNAQLAKLGYANCLTPDHKVLTSDMQWVSIGDLAEGDHLIGFDEKPLLPRHLRRYRLAEITGLEHRRADVFRIVLSDGTELKATGEHQWIVVYAGGGQQYWKATKDLRAGHILPRFFKPWTVQRTYDAGWLAGIIDGEGSAGHYYYKHNDRHNTHVAISQNPGLVLDRACELLRQWGFSFSLTATTGDTSSLNQMIQIGSKAEVARLLGMTRPTRLLSKMKPEWLRALRGISHGTVETVEKIGERDIVTFGTTTGTYIADGYASHNCYLWRFRDEIVPRYSKKTGWETNRRSKPWLVGFAVHEMINNRVKIHSELLLREMETFVQQGPHEWGAVAGCYDDRVCAWMIALLASDDECFERYYGLRREVDSATIGKEDTKRRPQSWECDSTFLKPVSRDDEWLPWEDHGAERSFI